VNDMGPGETTSAGGSGMKDSLRALGAVLGLGMICFGGYWSIKIFFTILKILKTPEIMMPFIQIWGSLFKLEAFHIATAQGTINLDLKWIVVSFLGAGAFLLSSIAIRLLLAGTTLLSAMVTDAEVLKKIVAKALTKVSSANRSGSDQASS